MMGMELEYQCLRNITRLKEVFLKYCKVSREMMNKKVLKSSG